MTIKRGFPPKIVEISEVTTSKSLKDVGLKNGEQIILEILEPN